MTSRVPWWRVAIRPRMLGLLVVFLAMAMVCARLGVWQLDRAQQRAELAERHAAAEAAQAEPDGLGTVLPPQTQMSGDDVGRKVWVEGSFTVEEQLLVSDREVKGKLGYLVLTALRVSDDGTEGSSWRGLSGPPVLAVVRGWVATPEEIAPPPEGLVRFEAYLQSPEAAGQRPTGPQVTDSIAPSALVGLWGGPTYSAYVVTVDPLGNGLTQVERPTIQGSSGLNIQNAFYAAQWWLFGAFALGLWARSVRDEARGVRRRTRQVR